MRVMKTNGRRRRGRGAATFPGEIGRRRWRSRCPRLGRRLPNPLDSSPSRHGATDSKGERAQVCGARPRRRRERTSTELVKRVIAGRGGRGHSLPL